MSSPISGINGWIAGIRYRMENDPGRQDLKDHILYNGFLFLDEYLEDILMGAKTEPIIELTKTPGRRKDVSKKVRSATAAATKTASLQEIKSPDKENTPVTELSNIKKPSAFKKTLLKASKENQSSDPEPVVTTVYSPSGSESRSLVGPAVQFPEKDIQEGTTARTLIASLLHGVASGPRSGTVNANLFSPSAKPPLEIPEGVAVELQEDADADAVLCIPEGDEPRILGMPCPNLRIIQEKVISCPASKSPIDPAKQKATATLSFDPTADDQDDTQAFPTPTDRSFNDSEPASTASSFLIDPYARDYETHGLRHMMESEQSSEQVPPSQSPQGQTHVRKASVPVFPNLPGPSPLRKSVHESSCSGLALINTHPSFTAGSSTRSSWLNKVRDVSAKQISVVDGPKRKNVDIEPSLTHPDGGVSRATKIAKKHGEGDGTNSEISQSKMSIQPIRPTVLSGSQEQSVVQKAAAAAPDVNPEGMIDILKRTVEVLEARAGKGMGRSLGGAAAAAAAAEAKAAAEVRLAQRDAKESDGNRQSEFSVPGLDGIYNNEEDKGKEYTYIQQDHKPSVLGADPGSMTIPRRPDSPSILHKSPVSLTTTHIIPMFTVKRHLPLEPASSFSDSQPSTQSTHGSSLFDSAWPPSSQLTDFTASQGFSQAEPQTKNLSSPGEYAISPLPQEVSWPHNLPDRLMPQEQAVDESQESKIGVVRDWAEIQGEGNNTIPGASALEKDTALNSLYGMDVESEEETTVGMSQSTSSALSEMSTTKNQPSSQTGFVAQASDLISRVMGTSVSNILGTSKRSKAEPVKSIQLAAVAAKKQQEEADRKAARLREMDKRRAAIALKKAEQETVERAKKQGEPRKRDREEGQEKKVTRTAVKKVEDDVVKKRKVIVEIESKPEIIKPLPNKQYLGGSRTGKHVSQTQPAQSALSKVQQLGSATQSTIKLVGASQGELKAVPNFTKSVPKDKQLQSVLEDVQQPSRALNAQMQARVEAELSQVQQDKPAIPSESIELPEINSEYSDSDDENRPRTFDPPGWAQSPDLRLALESQSRMNPDDIFGPVRPLRMEEIFPTKQSRFRARTSSANWAGTDEVTRDEEVQYAKRMGYLEK